MSNHKLCEQIIGLAILITMLAGCSGGTPTYSQILNTYPSGARLCQTVVSIEEVAADGSWKLDGTFGVQDGRIVYECFGTKVTGNVPVEIGDKTYEPGTKFTVDKDLQWVEVSSWN